MLTSQFRYSFKISYLRLFNHPATPRLSSLSPPFSDGLQFTRWFEVGCLLGQLQMDFIQVITYLRCSMTRPDLLILRGAIDLTCSSATEP